MKVPATVSTLVANTKPERLAADRSAANLNWLVEDKQIAPHIPVIDKVQV